MENNGNNNRSITGQTFMIAGMVLLIGVSSFCVLAIDRVDGQLVSMSHRMDSLTERSEAAVPVSAGGIGTEDSMLHEFTYQVMQVTEDTVTYKLQAFVKEHTQGDSVFFMCVTEGEDPKLYEASSPNGIFFTAQFSAPATASWSVDFVTDHEGTRKTERLEQIDSYEKIYLNLLGTPSLEGSTEFNLGSDSYVVNYHATVSMNMGNMKTERSKQAFLEILVNGQAQNTFQMNWHNNQEKYAASVPPENEDFDLENDGLAVTTGRTEIKGKPGDIIETVIRVETPSGKWYRHTAEKVRLTSNGTEHIDYDGELWTKE